jgi:hypothetical protein
MASLTLAQQGNLKKRVNYSINVAYSLGVSGYIFPPGNYVLRQVSDNDLNMFYLYQGNMMHGPVAIIKTTRIEYSHNEYPEDTNLLLDTVESKGADYVVLRGWHVPGEDGWEVIGVVAKNTRGLARR